MNIFGGIIGVITGVLIIKYSIQITNGLGRIEWAEQHLAGGLAGTISLYRIMGVVVIILSFLYMFGSIGFILGPIANLFGGAKTPQ